MGGVVAPGVEEPEGTSALRAFEGEAPASCHAGIEGRPVNGGRGDEGELDIVGPRLRRSALRDFNSCCSSARDWFWLSFVFSIICNGVSMLALICSGGEFTFGSISRMLLTSSLTSRISSRVFTSPSRISLTAASTSAVVLSTFSFCSSTAERTAAVSA